RPPGRQPPALRPRSRRPGRAAQVRGIVLGGHADAFRQVRGTGTGGPDMTPPEPSRQDVEPVRMTVRVRRNIEDAFDIFTRDIGSWWPLDYASFGGDRASELHFEPYAGGRFYERYKDGEEHTGGRVLRWEPPRLVAYTWQHDDWSAPTEV